jgi:hypothetical protein
VIGRKASHHPGVVWHRNHQSERKMKMEDIKMLHIHNNYGAIPFVVYTQESKIVWGKAGDADEFPAYTHVFWEETIDENKEHVVGLLWPFPPPGHLPMIDIQFASAYKCSTSEETKQRIKKDVETIHGIIGLTDIRIQGDPATGTWIISPNGVLSTHTQYNPIGD